MTSVLLAEDDLDLRQVTTMLLTSWGCEVTAVADGCEARGRLDEGTTYDVLVLDLDMPVVSGLEVAERARELGHRGPVVVWTGWSGRVSAEEVARWELVLLSKHDANELSSIVAAAEPPRPLP